jgi:hypothetical protein
MMKPLRPTFAIAAAIALLSSPLAAAPQAAARLSLVKNVRAGTPIKSNKNELRGASLTLILGVIAAVAGITYLVVGKNSKSP